MSRAMPKTSRWFLVALAAVVALFVPGCGSSNPLGGGEITGDLKSIKIGSADFTESKIIAELYAQALEANGFTITRQFGIGFLRNYGAVVLQAFVLVLAFAIYQTLSSGWAGEAFANLSDDPVAAALQVGASYIFMGVVMSMIVLGSGRIASEIIGN